MSYLNIVPQDVAHEIWRRVYDGCLTDITTKAKKVILNKRKQYFYEYNRLKEEYVAEQWIQWGQRLYELEKTMKKMETDDKQRYYKVVKYLEYMNECINVS